MMTTILIYWTQKIKTIYQQKISDNDLYYILLDEIQLVSNFEGLLNGLLRKENLIYMLPAVILDSCHQILLPNLEVEEMR